jgi:predicted kinase
MKQFFLILNGPSCGGKSTTADAIKEKLPKVFNARQDRIKWLISDYGLGKYKTVVEEMVFSMIEIALNNKLSIIKEGVLDKPTKFETLAKKHKVPFFIANISAPEETLQKRFKKRLVAVKKGAKIANTSQERFNFLMKLHEETKTKTELEFDSSKITPEEIANKIINYINNSS